MSQGALDFSAPETIYKVRILLKAKEGESRVRIRVSDRKDPAHDETRSNGVRGLQAGRSNPQQGAGRAIQGEHFGTNLLSTSAVHLETKALYVAELPKPPILRYLPRVLQDGA